MLFGIKIFPLRHYLHVGLEIKICFKMVYLTAFKIFGHLVKHYCVDAC